VILNLGFANRLIDLEWPLKYRFPDAVVLLVDSGFTKITVLLGLKFTVFFDIGQYCAANSLVGVNIKARIGLLSQLLTL
jgi:hypothetical protein